MPTLRKSPRFRSKFITPELTRLFSQSDSEEEFEGFSDSEDMMEVAESEDDSETNFYSDGEEPSTPKRKSLLVALRFPSSAKRLSLQKKKQTGKNARLQRQKVQQKQLKGKVNDEELSQSLKKRNKNIAENKAMLAKLFADLSSFTELTAPPTPQKKKSSPVKAKPKQRKFEPDTGSERRNPSRKARPPENFGVEEKPEPPPPKKPQMVNIRALLEVDEDRVDTGPTKKRRGKYYVKSVDEITEQDLNNIVYRVRDKIWDKDYGSSCHQCRQKTLDTKSVCRSGVCSGGKGQFCGLCLRNRYGEDVRTALLDPTWCCPICRGMCNCSLCRKKEGRCATGTLVQLARYNGHNSVHEYLESIQRELK